MNLSTLVYLDHVSGDWKWQIQLNCIHPLWPYHKQIKIYAKQNLPHACAGDIFVARANKVEFRLENLFLSLTVIFSDFSCHSQRLLMIFLYIFTFSCSLSWVARRNNSL